MATLPISIFRPSQLGEPDLAAFGIHGFASILSADVILCSYYTSRFRSVAVRGIVEYLTHIRDQFVDADDEEDDEEDDDDFEEGEEESGEEGAGAEGEGDEGEEQGDDEPPAKRQKRDGDDKKKKDEGDEEGEEEEEEEGEGEEEEVCLRWQ